MSLQVGQQPPPFALDNQDGKRVQLSDFLGQWVVLYFYPKDDTPGCTREAIGFSNAKTDFDALNTVILGLSKDTVESHEQFCGKYNLDIDLLSDPEKTAIFAYDVWQEKTSYGKTSMGIVRSTFLIDPNGIIRKIWSNVKVDEHVQAVRDELQQLIQG
jgi:thioredoxin-dependent peroxiredoxin